MLKQLTKNILYLPSCEQTDRPALGYIAGREASLMVDAGNSPAHAQLFLSQLRQEGLAAPDYVVLTHWHWDHCFGLSALSAISLCSSKTQEKLREMSAWGWSEEQMQKRLQTGQEIAFCHENILKEYSDRRHICVRAAELSFSGELSIDLGGRTARLLPLSNSHAEGSLAVFVPEERALLLGDIICPDYYGSMPPRHCPKKLAQLIAQLNALDFDTVLYGHGEPAQVCKAELLADLQSALAEVLPA